ncbi:hypothetical protein SAMN02745691_02389 [Parasporobacterium paucivorans DSM 15970]|uniref:PASTA domain-containing protein n=1 Tax=Parasporobacterium paucivorans DSM 15970 TaxID=1122934 RepID=A0A1M6LFB7_9FIRM|nr:hypothetical protein SAMN02745691_02389 [Parasporobacterium paucivorans DSM 15970]
MVEIYLSKELSQNVVQKFKVPEVLGLNVNEAREDLEVLGLKVTGKLEKPGPTFASFGKDDSYEPNVEVRIDYYVISESGSSSKSNSQLTAYYTQKLFIHKDFRGKTDE